MDLKSLLIKQGIKLIQDPRVLKLMQDERVMKALMQAMQMRGRVQEGIDERVEKLAKTLNLATKQEVRELKRAMRKMERELDRANSQGGGGDSNG